MKSVHSVASKLGRPVFVHAHGGVEARYLVDDRYCSETGCHGQELEVVLMRVGGPGEDLSLRLDLSGARASWDASADPERQALAEAFVRDRRMLETLTRRRQLVRAWGLSKAGASGRRVELGRTYSLGDFDPQGEACALDLELGGAAWAVVDQYCVRPDCPCTSALLAFCRIADGRAKEVHTIAVDLHTGAACEARTEAALSPEQSRAWSALRDRLGPTWREELGLRRELVREIAARALDRRDPARAPRTQVSVGRNDACPCGSGKKYKRCCAQVAVRRA